MKHTKALFIKVIALCLVFSLAVPATAYAAEAETVMPLASYYLSAYAASVEAVGNGEVQIWYEVMGTGDMDEIGVLSIKLYESTDNTNWTRVETFLHEENPTMLAYDDYFYCSCVSYQGTVGKYYRAYVCIWAGKNGLGDTRYVWTNSRRAT